LPEQPSESKPGGSTSSRGPLGVVFFTIFLDLLGFGIIIPIQPFYAEAFGASPTVVTLLGASYSLMQFVFAPFWGRLSDRYGRRPIILTSITIGAVGYLIFGLAGSLGVLFAARMLSGFGNANIATAQAVIADVTGPADRAKGMGLIGAAFGLGFIFGPALGGFVGQWGPQYPAFLAAGLGCVNLLLALRFLPETRRPTNHHEAAHRFSLERVRAALSVPGVAGMLAVFFLVTTGFSLMEQVLGLTIERIWVVGGPYALGLAQGSPASHARAALMTGQFLVVIGVTAAIVQGGLIGRLTRRFGEARLLVFGLGALSLSLVLIPIAGQVAPFWSLIPIGVLMAVGSGLTTPSITSALSQLSSSENQGGVLGVGQSASALGRVVGPAVSGALFEVAIPLPYLVGATLMVVAGAFALMTFRRDDIALGFAATR